MIDELRIKMLDLENRLKEIGAAYTPGRPKPIN